MDSKPDRTAKISQFLGRVPLFAGISKRNLETLAGESRIKQAPRGTFLFFRGDPANAVFVILAGAVVIHVENLDGRELVINEVGIGDCFGELGILTGQPHSANAEAMVDSEVVVIPGSTFKFILERNQAWHCDCLRSRPCVYKTAAAGKKRWHFMMPDSVWHTCFCTLINSPANGDILPFRRKTMPKGPALPAKPLPPSLGIGGAEAGCSPGAAILSY